MLERQVTAYILLLLMLLLLLLLFLALLLLLLHVVLQHIVDEMSLYRLFVDELSLCAVVPPIR